MKVKFEVHFTVDELFHQFGVPTALISDNANKLIKSEFGKKCRQARCPIDSTDPYNPWQNWAESEIRENKRLTV